MLISVIKTVGEFYEVELRDGDMTQLLKDARRMAVTTRRRAYDIMAREILKIQWDRPKYTAKEILPSIPEEKELDQLIAACRSRRMAAFLQTLKETYADPGEAKKV